MVTPETLAAASRVAQHGARAAMRAALANTTAAPGAGDTPAQAAEPAPLSPVSLPQEGPA